MKRPGKTTLAWTAGYLFLALLGTWPLALHLRGAIPLGTETAATVPLFNLWTLEWNADRVAHAYADYWQAPIFHPTPDAFARSDPQPLTGLVFAILRAVCGDAVLSYNLILLCALTFNGLAMRHLMRRIGAGRAAAGLAGVFAVTLPFVANELGVLQLVMLFPVLYCLSAIVEIRKTPGFRSGARLGVWFAASFLTCSYYALFLVVFLALAGGLMLRDRRQRGRIVVGFASAALLGGLGVLPVAVAQLRVARGHSRSAQAVLYTSAHPIDYVRLHPRTWGSHRTPWLASSGGSTHFLYPGTGLLALAGIGGIAGWRKRFSWWMVFALSGAALALFCSFGTRIQLGGWAPFEAIRVHVPGLAMLRNTFRFAANLQLLLVILASIGMDRLWARAGRRGRWGLAVVAMASLWEVAALPIRLHPIDDATLDAPWAAFLSERPAGPAVMIPVRRGKKASTYEPTVLAMLQAQRYGIPLVNGYSGLFPHSHRARFDALASFPSESSLRQLRGDGVRFVVFDADWPDPTLHRAIAARADVLRPVFEDADKIIYELIRSPSESPP